MSQFQLVPRSDKLYDFLEVREMHITLMHAPAFDSLVMICAHFVQIYDLSPSGVPCNVQCQSFIPSPAIAQAIHDNDEAALAPFALSVYVDL